MQKIPTVLARDENGQVVDTWLVHPAILKGCIPTEKLDGMNVRVTIRSGECLRLEKRRNPTKVQKQKGIVDPWYTDTGGSDDKHLFEATRNTDFSGIPDGEWPAEAIGPKIQGNPLQLKEPRVVIFSTGRFLNPSLMHDGDTGEELTGDGPLAALTNGHPPLEFENLRDWLMHQPSAFNPDQVIEGVVWHAVNGGPPIAKIKAKDFAP